MNDIALWKNNPFSLSPIELLPLPPSSTHPHCLHIRWCNSNHTITTLHLPFSVICHRLPLLYFCFCAHCHTVLMLSHHLRQSHGSGKPEWVTGRVLMGISLGRPSATPFMGIAGIDRLILLNQLCKNLKTKSCDARDKHKRRKTG